MEFNFQEHEKLVDEIRKQFLSRTPQVSDLSVISGDNDVKDSDFNPNGSENNNNNFKTEIIMEDEKDFENIKSILLRSFGKLSNLQNNNNDKISLNKFHQHNQNIGQTKKQKQRIKKGNLTKPSLTRRRADSGRQPNLGGRRMGGGNPT